MEASSSKNRELFKKIFDLSLSESELDDLAGKLDGYRISGENPPKSTARVDVVLQKAGAGNDYFRRKVTVRHEKKGWGVLDVAGATEFKMGGMRRMLAAAEFASDCLGQLPRAGMQRRQHV